MVYIVTYNTTACSFLMNHPWVPKVCHLLLKDMGEGLKEKMKMSDIHIGWITMNLLQHLISNFGRIDMETPLDP